MQLKRNTTKTMAHLKKGVLIIGKKRLLLVLVLLFFLMLIPLKSESFSNCEGNCCANPHWTYTGVGSSCAVCETHAYGCVIGKCGATCVNDAGCNGCNGTTRYWNRICGIGGDRCVCLQGNSEDCATKASVCTSVSNYRDYVSCSGSACTYTDYDSDSAQGYCDACKGAGYWNLGGEVSATTCCEDAGENNDVFTEYAGTAHGVIDWGASQDACCDSSSDQINYSGACVTSGGGGNAVDTGYTGHDKYAYPYTSGWLDLDGHSTWPAAFGANVCSGGWMDMSSGDSTGERCGTAGGDACDEDGNYGCCGDDAGENYSTFTDYAGNAHGVQDWGSTQKACCDAADQINYSGACVTSGSGGNAVATGYTGDDKYAYPYTSGWLDLDGHSTWPAAFGANVCSGGWMDMSSGDSTGERCGTAGGDACDEDGNYGCCGDDAGENGQTRVCASGCTTSSSDKACCNASTDCVYGSTCYSTGWTGTAPWDAGVNGSCTSGSWSLLSSCNYISGNWVVQCSEGCNLSTAKDLGGNNITFSGTGTVTITANITNWTRATVQGGCHVISSSGGGLKN